MGRGKGALPACIILIAILYYLMVVLYSIAIALFIAAIICAAVYGCYRFFLSIYFSSQKFAKLKVSIRDNIRDCNELNSHCLLYTYPRQRDLSTSRMPSSA